nr:hypothetical protein Q903MT_gene4690 [Picea sitchensis]
MRVLRVLPLPTSRRYIIWLGLAGINNNNLNHNLWKREQQLTMALGWPRQRPVGE